MAVYVLLNHGLCAWDNRVWFLLLAPTMSHGAKVWMVLPLAQLHTISKVPVSPNGKCSLPFAVAAKSFIVLLCPLFSCVTHHAHFFIISTRNSILGVLLWAFPMVPLLWLLRKQPGVWLAMLQFLRWENHSSCIGDLGSSGILFVENFNFKFKIR